MTAKKSFYILCLINSLLIIVYALYLLLPEQYYLGHYPIGIIQIFLLILAILSVCLHIRYSILVIKKLELKSVLLILAYAFPILLMSFSLLVWGATLPL